MRLSVLPAAALLLMFFSASAADAPKGHPLISAYPGAELKKEDTKEYDAYKAFTGIDEDGAPDGLSLEGRITRLFYKNPKDRSVLEMYRNYESALNGAGAETLYACNQEEYECVKRYAQSALGAYNGLSAVTNTAGRYLLAELAQEEGYKAYIAVAVGPLFTEIHIAEVKKMETDMVKIDAAALGEAIDAHGYVIAEGLYFDTDRTTLKAESAPALEEIAAMLKNRPALGVFVVGHTDNTGDVQYNLRLSEGRARTVATALTSQYGVAAARLSPHGIGPLSPVGENATAAGRAKNRRVTLVRR